jgi:hypothetical protein
MGAWLSKRKWKEIHMRDEPPKSPNVYPLPFGGPSFENRPFRAGTDRDAHYVESRIMASHPKPSTRNKLPGNATGISQNLLILWIL